MVLAVVVGLMLSVAGCSSYVNGYKIEPGADLVCANLTNANLYRANLKGTDLSGANLTDADLTGANLDDATLTRAKMPVGWQQIVAAY